MIEALVEAHGCAHASFNDPPEALNYYKENARKITLMINRPLLGKRAHVRGYLNRRHYAFVMEAAGSGGRGHVTEGPGVDGLAGRRRWAFRNMRPADR
jgi:hypothetical protein